jgi:hypothetical protein
MASKRKEQYRLNKKAKVGDEIVCPICGKTFIKKQWQQAFCCGSCKDRFWNDKGDRHTDPNYHTKYNQKHPERYEYLLGKGATRAEIEHNRALYELATNADFREYVNGSDYDGSWDEHACRNDLGTMLENYENDLIDAGLI